MTNVVVLLSRAEARVITLNRNCTNNHPLICHDEKFKLHILQFVPVCVYILYPCEVLENWNNGFPLWDFIHCTLNTCKCFVWQSCQSPWNNMQWAGNNFVVTAAHSGLMKSPSQKLLSRQKTLYHQKFLKCQQGCSPYINPWILWGYFYLSFFVSFILFFFFSSFSFIFLFIRCMSNQVYIYYADLCTNKE